MFREKMQLSKVESNNWFRECDEVTYVQASMGAVLPRCEYKKSALSAARVGTVEVPARGPALGVCA